MEKEDNIIVTVKYMKVNGKMTKGSFSLYIYSYTKYIII